MPYYEYHCPANGRTVEVHHGMSESLETWSDVVSRTDADPGDTPPQSPVERLMSVSAPIVGSSPPVGGCGSGCGCAVPR